MDELVIRVAVAGDNGLLRQAFIELQEYERILHWSRLLGEVIADAYIASLHREVIKGGAILVAEAGGTFAGFAAGWIEQNSFIAETPESNRYGYVSDICVLPPYRGHGIAGRLLAALEVRLAEFGITTVRLGVLGGNHAARSAYRRAGFTPYEMTYESVSDAGVPHPAPRCRIFTSAGAGTKIGR